MGTGEAMTQQFIPGETYPKRGGGSAVVHHISDRGDIVDTDGCHYWHDGRISRVHEMRGDLLPQDVPRVADAPTDDAALRDEFIATMNELALEWLRLSGKGGRI